MKFIDALKERVLIFDGAMGSSIHEFDLSLDDYLGYENCPEILVESRPDVIMQIHESYLKVGCDAIETDTFGGTPIVLAEFGLADRAYELNKKAALVAREIAASYSTKDKPRYVSGSIGPTTKLPSLGHVSFDDLREAYYIQVSGLIDGGVDVLQFETGQDLQQAKAAILAMLDRFREIGRRLPIITQMTIEAPPLGTLLVGSDISAALTVLSAFPVDIIGLNCSTGPVEMIDPVQYLCSTSNKFISVLPNAGLPENQDGKTVYKLTPDELAKSLKYFVKEQGVNIVGGCCGTTPAHLKRVVEEIGKSAPIQRKTETQASCASLYTSQTLQVEPAPVIVGERTNTNGSKKFKELLQKEDWDGMVSMAREQEKEGAHVLDVCTAYVGRNEIEDMCKLIKRLNTDVQIPLVVDTTEYSVLEETLKLISGKPIVNSINLEDGEEKMIRKIELIARYGAAAVALTIDETGMAKESARKFEVARRIYDLAIAGGIAPEDLIFDALTFTLSTGNEDDRKLGLETLDGIKLIKERLPGVKTILGVSNISFGFHPTIRQILNSVYLHYAVEYGLDMAIVNAQKILPLYKIDDEERELHRKLIFDLRDDNDPLFTLLDFYKDRTDKTSESTSSSKAPPKEIEDVLKQRIIDGNRVGLDSDLQKALGKYPPLTIINELLLDGMKVVGDLFGSGKMQLPFVLQSAETMKAAVSFLEPFMDKIEGSQRGTMVLATVKGDVHDIGKNLVDIILTNNGYKVVNLGIKQPIENIVASARDHQASCIGMSGLLVKSTVVMKENLEVLNQHGITTPVILGGAALTRRYVEEDCRKVYKGQLFYGQDAFDDLHIMEKLAQARRAEADGKSVIPSQPEPNGKRGVGSNDVAATVPDQETMCGSEEESDVSASLSSTTRPNLDVGSGADSGLDSSLDSSLESSLDSSLDPGASDSLSIGQSSVERCIDIPEPPFWGSRVLSDFDLSEMFSFINETALIKGQWRVRQGDTADEEYHQLLETKIFPVLRDWKERCIAEKLLQPKAVYGYFPCYSVGDDLVVLKEDRATEWVRFRFPRQKQGRRLCVADFFARREEGRLDVLPLQVVTMGAVASEYSQGLFTSDRYSDYLYFHGLSVESAEALAELLHKRIRAELGYAAEDSAERSKFFQQGYRGTRYSFGYPACPNLEDQAQLFELLQPDRIGVSLTEEFQLVPEQSTTAVVVIHPQAKYFNIN